MGTDVRSRIMARVRRSSRGRDSAEIEAELAGFGTAPTAPLPHEDACAAFMVNVLKNHGTLSVAADRTAAVKAVGQYLYQHYRSHRLVAGNDPNLAAMPWRDGGVLPRFGELEPGEPVALSYARWGIAETGAIVTLTGKSNPAANNLLPEHHIVLLDSANLLTYLEQLWQALARELETRERPRGINCIAGPSSTADVEATLVYGAHGPRHWHVILLGNFPDSLEADARNIAGKAEQAASS